MRELRKIMLGVSYVLVILIVLNGAVMAAESKGGCELALYRCMTDPMNLMQSTEGLVYCSIGYIFCKKYIEN